jgi:dihydrofolate reductase
MIGLPTTPVVSAILAQNKDGVIGVDGKLPWYNKDDLKFYKANTLNCVVIVGRKTFESLPEQALSDRYHIVVTSQKMLNVPVVYSDNVITESSVETAFLAAVQYCKRDAKVRGIVFAGGASIYKEAESIGLVDEVLMTVIDEPTPSDAEEIVYTPYSSNPCGGILCDAHQGEKAEWNLYVRGGSSLETKMYLRTKFKANLKVAGII